MAGRGKVAEKRGKGRPTASAKGVGREALIAAAKQLLQELTPAQVTIAAIARRAGADPALVRYYFGNRETLLLEVAQSIGADTNRPRPEDGDPLDLMAQSIQATFRFTRSAKNMQRLMIEELDSARSPDVRDKVREWNRQPVAYYDTIKLLDDGHELTDFDALFMHLAVVGISDFFVSGAPLVELLVPEGTDMDELGKQYEAFVTRLLIDGLRRRA